VAIGSSARPADLGEADRPEVFPILPQFWYMYPYIHDSFKTYGTLLE
jgi:hypothetical protein